MFARSLTGRERMDAAFFLGKWRRRTRRRGNRQTACKPGSVPASRRGMTIPLGRPLPDASRDRPGRRRGNPPGPKACRPYLVLLPVGFTLPPPLPAVRCALTAPFHPCRPAALQRLPRLAVCFCGTFPGVAPAGRYPAPCFRGARTFLPHADRCRSAEGGHLAVWRAQS